MKFLVRWAFRFLILLLVLSIGLLLLKDTIFKSLAENHLRRQTGLEVRIGRMEVGLFSPVVTVEHCRIYNSAEFGGSPFLELPELHIEYDRAAARNGHIKLKLLRLNLAELNVVRNAAGQTNLMGLAAFLQPRPANSQPGSPKPTTSSTFEGIDTLNFSLGKITFTDLRSPIVTREFRLDVRNEITTDLRTELDVIGVLARILVQRGITIIELPVTPTKPH